MEADATAPSVVAVGAHFLFHFNLLQLTRSHQIRSNADPPLWFALGSACLVWRAINNSLMRKNHLN